jgi:hypothetical protein
MEPTRLLSRLRTGWEVRLEFRKSAVNRCAYTPSDMCRTESYDDMGPVDEDIRWNIFSTLHNYLLGAFPLV